MSNMSPVPCIVAEGPPSAAIVAQEGDRYVDSLTNAEYQFIGGAWVNISSDASNLYSYDGEPTTANNDPSSGGQINIHSGTGGDTYGIYSGSYGGRIDIRTGDAFTTNANPYSGAYGGTIYLRGGDADGQFASYGGHIIIVGGDGLSSLGPSYAEGGFVKIKGGNALGYDGGDVYLKPGYGATDGNLIIKNIPNAAAGLPAGAIWFDPGAANVLKIV